LRIRGYEHIKITGVSRVTMDGHGIAPYNQMADLMLGE